MAQQTINVGAAPNDGTGTPLRTAFQYTNSNFTELYTAVGPSGNNIVVPGTATITGALGAAGLNVTGATIPANGVYLGSANNLTFAFNSTLGMSLNSGGLLVNNTSGFNTVANIKLKVGGRFLSGISGVGAYSFGTADAGGFVINDAGDGSTESRLLTLNSTGLGVGVASPTNKLDVNGNAAFTGFGINANPLNATSTSQRQVRFQNTGGDFYLGIEGSTGGGFFSGSTAYAACLYNAANTPLQFFTNGTLRSTIDTSGNVGIGVTPSAWNTLTPVQVKNAAFSGYLNNAYVTSNAYYDSTFKYIAGSSGAALYNQASGVHSWYYDSGTQVAGQNTTFIQAMTLDASGNLFIGKTATGLGTVGIQASPSGWLQATVSGDASLFTNRLASDGKTVQFYRQTLEVGNISVTTTGATFNSTSDYRLKEAVAPLSGGLARVNALKPSVYKWKSNGLSGEGFLAHELAEVVPAAVNGEKDAVNEDGSINAQSIDMSRVVPILVAAIQELTARVQTLEAK